MKRRILTLAVCIFTVASTSAVPMDMVWSDYINESGFTGYMSKYETTNAQYCEFLNAALASGDITIFTTDHGLVKSVNGASGSNSGEDFVGQPYYLLIGEGDAGGGDPIVGGAARINYTGSSFTVDSGFENHPVTYVSWYGANAFCNYYGYRLPTELEWQAVADYSGSYMYGCGGTINNNIANYFGSIHPNGTTIVGAFGTYGYGMCDMAGNVWEWTNSCYYPYSDCGNQPRVTRGGGWYYPETCCAVSLRGAQSKEDTECVVGFRVVGIPESATITASADTFSSGANQFTIDFVLISGSTNPTSGIPAGTGFTFTGVNHDYRMGTYEITNDQWNKFKAAYGEVTGSPSGAYDSAPYFTGTNVPTNNVSWYEAAQFVNWLNTSKGYQAAYKFTGTINTSDYALDVWGAGDADGTNLYRHKDAVYYLPTDDEWVKAAYWNGITLQTYATKARDTLFQGNGTNGGWNYYDGPLDMGPDGPAEGPWAVGSGSQELNGTHDMMGNVHEWIESPYYSGDYRADAAGRVVRGGSYNYTNGDFASSTRSAHGSNGSEYLGFRVASIIPIPIPVTLLLHDPNGSENIGAGTIHTISWSSTGSIGNVCIEFSTNNGETWNDVNTVPNSGSYNWLVSTVNSNQCLVRISDAAHPTIYDISNNVFTITQENPSGYPTLYEILGGSAPAIAESGRDFVARSIPDINVVAFILLEDAGYANENVFGIYSASDPQQKLQLFSGADFPTDMTIVQFDAAAGTAKNLQTGQTANIDKYFGFYLTAPQNGGITYYTDLTRNPDSLEHGLIYNTSGFAGVIENDPDTVIAFEDLLGLGDRDYNDMIVGITNAVPLAGSTPYCIKVIPGDINGDCKVNLVDFAVIAAHWCECNLDPQEACGQ